jgi:Domain of unknown function DUF108
LKVVTYTSLKGPNAWEGTPAQNLLGENAKRDRVIFFSGSAREAALHYPQNANVGAAIVLAGLGLDRTRVQFGSDPHVAGPQGIIERKVSSVICISRFLRSRRRPIPRPLAMRGLLQFVCWSRRTLAAPLASRFWTPAAKRSAKRAPFGSA